ncbi:MULTISPECIES: hypothetical protein [Pseudoalteromonas]|uniref:Lipoprotein n=1 Tax=Pseudoalteromonas amylolytica TaxID=1859457 RepID=A0A1S1MZ72_9GAMM|nr:MULTISPECIES: hypothetical protein [Pseudoalteromonas]OHU84630.1 hypothetical protein BFC16_00740 [Pseudoalteromonas sp. JW3]OHU92461.1 hypothetical protein BET10_05250 [Pseudoalteromonas amylolytica]
MMKLTHAMLLSLTLAGCAQSEDSDNTSTNVHAKKQESPTVVAKQSEERKLDVSLDEKTVLNVTDVEKKDIDELHEQLKSLTQDLSCDNTSQCHIKAVGSRACGGPSSYLIYSSKSSSTTEVTELAKKITAYESSFNFKNNMMSICEHLTRPSTQCVENKCVTLSNTSQEAY